MNGLSFESYWRRLDAIQRTSLSYFPTPLLPMRELARTLGDVDLWIKRDDLISFGLGGNKVRGLEFLMAEALDQRADTIVTGAGTQSNHVRAAAAAATYCGLRTKAVFWGDEPAVTDGNYRVTRMLGADVEFTGDIDRASVDAGIDRCCEKLRLRGLRPYSIPRGGACALGALGHVLAARELYEQCREVEVKPKRILMASGSGGTHAGWLVGSYLLGCPWQVESVTVSREIPDVREQIVRLANESAGLLDLDWPFRTDEVVVHGGFIGAGYGIPSAKGAEAIKRVGRLEGILLDPTYTGKAMAGLFESVKNGLEKHDSIVFLHTGGEPAFFAGSGSWLEESREGLAGERHDKGETGTCI